MISLAWRTEAVAAHTVMPPVEEVSDAVVTGLNDGLFDLGQLQETVDRWQGSILLDERFRVLCDNSIFTLFYPVG